MTARPAARAGDPTAHGQPLPAAGGSPDTLIESMPAWRSDEDDHECAAPGQPHGAETCFHGSFSVVINGRQAVRVDDPLVSGGGPPNAVVQGAGTVVIGDRPFGLADPDNLREWCQDLKKILAHWDEMTPEERGKALTAALNKQLEKQGIPGAGILIEPMCNADGTFQGQLWLIHVRQELLQGGAPSASAAKWLGNALYHETRHAEQTFDVARYLAGQPGMTAAEVARQLSLPIDVAMAAFANPLRGAGAVQNFGRTIYESIYGAGREYRTGVIQALRSGSNAPGVYERYRNLPEEKDAWDTGNATGNCGC